MFLFFATLVACSGSSEPAATPAPAPAPAAAPAPAPEPEHHDDDHAGEAQHGAADAAPGSHADWCGEHAVAESQCTRCNSSLIPAFKATGDWCDEHGLPDSQCLTCDPDLVIERPPAGG